MVAIAALSVYKLNGKGHRRDLLVVAVATVGFLAIAWVYTYVQRMCAGALAVLSLQCRKLTGIPHSHDRPWDSPTFSPPLRQAHFTSTGTSALRPPPRVERASSGQRPMAVPQTEVPGPTAMARPMARPLPP